MESHGEDAVRIQRAWRRSTARTAVRVRAWSRERAPCGVCHDECDEADVTSEPIAHLQFHGATSTPHDPLIAFTMQNVVDEFDTESELVRWLLNQMSTYDPGRQTIVGLVFDASTILSEVLHAHTRS